ncbi:MAG: signal peptidase I [Parcubacteria group bacterium RIFCSPLOWO2_01_FULL_40_65]|nr:MAG: signal peptidase I [Parcubacteria group bacterium RIFCSPHIGHO2_01_FULL_40_30]OHB19284.1 MAG: signal peptidase I [Parcubacteria group bacterium RIFCSPHIGHO2_02_FULL_40_12]OHB21650.1 MAG: signal peptidase I [Parcubacteria group bacterium RIFCSPLOWO2_01_FULL_40_65]OHB23373.1 MAG: signal peptidase I [Parcubacteria group bacterium RIFCSPLOWO2_02_FULL_40_12]OHB24483.1 MAG: signal peptidase I [Parcubacteria group bacterium RIFCSPLOWO2_12_FULL_40_10]
MGEEIKSQNKKSRENFFLFLLEIIKILILALAIILPIRYFIAQPFFVKGASMESAFEDGDYLIINEISYRFSEPQRGDTVVFRYPENPRQYFIKRIIGLPNETIEIKNNQAKVFNEGNPNGFILDESSYLDSGQITEGSLRVKLYENEYFVLGDNRLHSSDSRRWGVLNKSYIIGKVFIRAWPVDKIKYFTPEIYLVPAK